MAGGPAEQSPEGATESAEGGPAVGQEALTDAAEGMGAFDEADTVEIAEESGAAAEGPVTIVGRARSFVESNPMAGYPLLGIVGFMGVTFVIAVVKTMARGTSSTGRRAKQVNKNLAVVTELSRYLPENRAGLSGRAIAGIRLRTGFKPSEIFRKYLWYILRERKYVPVSVSVPAGSLVSGSRLLLSRTHARAHALTVSENVAGLDPTAWRISSHCGQPWISATTT